MRCRLVSTPPNGEGIRKRVRAALCKAERGEELTDNELMIIQWVTRAGGCYACSPKVRILREKGRRSEGGDR